MTIKTISQPRQLTIAGLTLPYFVIIMFTGIIILMPGTADEKIAKIGSVAFLVPLITAFVGAMLVGVGSVKKEKTEERGKSVINAFIFGFLWTGIFHFFITLYLFMMIVYSYAGLRFG
jgi:hypothetical protein